MTLAVCDWQELSPDKLLWQPGVLHGDEDDRNGGDGDGEEMLVTQCPLCMVMKIIAKMIQ